MDDEELRALEAAARELRLRANDPAAADDVRTAAAAAFVERRATEARQLVVRCREILVEAAIPPDTEVTVRLGSPETRPPIWDSGRDPMLRYRGWACGPGHHPGVSSRPPDNPRLILPTTADTMIGSQDATGSPDTTASSGTIAPPDERSREGDQEHHLLMDDELARRLGDGSLAASLTELLVAHDLTWTSAVPRSDRPLDRLRAWWHRVAPP